MDQIHDVLKTIGRKRVCEGLDIGPTAVSNAKIAGAFPASWYKVIRDLARENGEDVPEHLFKWREAKAGTHEGAE